MFSRVNRYCPMQMCIRDSIITVNTETAAALDLDYSAFNDLAGTVVEVETTAE